MRPNDPNYEYLLLIADALATCVTTSYSWADLRRDSC